MLFDILGVHNESSDLLPNLYYETYAFKLSWNITKYNEVFS